MFVCSLIIIITVGSRIVLPMTVQEYQIGQLWTVAEFSKSETGGGDGVEVHVNEPFDQQRYCPEPSLLNDDPAYATGQYTKKTYHFKNRLTGILKLIPSSITSLSEEAWNAYPYCRTTISVRRSALPCNCHCIFTLFFPASSLHQQLGPNRIIPLRGFRIGKCEWILQRWKSEVDIHIYNYCGIA